MRRLELVAVAVIAVAGLAAAGLWAWTGQKSWKALMLERQVRMERQVSPKTLLEVWDRAQDLDKTFLPGTHVHLPGLVAHMMVMENRIPVEKRAAALVAGDASIRNALAREPAHAHGWARLAWFDQLYNGPSPDVVAALRMSVYTAPARNSLLFWRLESAGANSEYWDADFKNLLRRQVMYAWRVSPQRLAETVAKTPMEPVAADALSGSPEDEKHFEHLVSRYR